MKRKVNLRAIILGLVIILIGATLTLCACLKNSILSNIGCSLLTSGIVLLLTSWVIDVAKIYQVWNDMNLILSLKNMM